MPTFSEQIVDDSGYQRPVAGAQVYLLNVDGSTAIATSLNPTLTDDFGTFGFSASDGQYIFSARIGGVEIARGPAIIGNPPQYKGDPGPADNTYSTLAALLASDPARKSARLVPQAGETAPAGNFNYVNGAWVRQGADGVTFQQSGSGAIVRDLRTQVRELGISPRQFGATEADADQSAAVQLAINACLAISPPAPLRVDGYFRVDQPLIINRAVDTTTEMFEVVGVGYGSGFHTVAPITIFSTTLTRPSGADYPVVEKLRLRSLLFRGNSANTSAVTVMSGLFLRSESIDCDFKWCRFRYDPDGYSQSISLINAQVHDCGDFWTTKGAYNINIINPTIGACAGLFRSLPTPRGVRKWALFGGVYEANTGSLFVGSGVTGWSAEGLYLENLPANVFDFTPEYPSGGITYVNVHTLSMRGSMARYGSTGSRVIFSVVDIGGHWSPANGTDPRHRFVDGNVVDLTVIAGAGNPTYADSTYQVTMNGVTRYGQGEAWTSSGNQITKTDDGRFGYGGAPQPTTRSSFFSQNADGSSTIFAGYNSGGVRRLSLLDNGNLQIANAAGSLKMLQQNTAIASPNADTGALKTAVDAIRAALTASGITL